MDNLKELRNTGSRKEAFFHEKARIDQIVMTAVKTGNGETLVGLSDYFESQMGIDMVSVFGEMRILEFISQIMKIEREYRIAEGSFLHNISSYDDLFRKYRRTIYYLRRMEMGLGEECREEILLFLTEERISYVCICILCAGELFALKDKIILELYTLAKGTTCEETAANSMLCWLPASEVKDLILLKLAEYETGRGNFARAYIYLTRIKEPNEDVLQLIKCMEGVLNE